MHDVNNVLVQLCFGSYREKFSGDRFRVLTFVIWEIFDISGKVTADSNLEFFSFVVMSANHPNFQEQLTRKEHTDYPYIYRPSLCLRRETCSLLVSFSYHLSSLAFAFCLALQFQWHKCSFQRASSLSLTYWKNYDSKQLKTIFPIVFPTIVQLLHLTLG